MTTYKTFCALRDQRRAGEEAPEYTEKRAFEIAVLALISKPALTFEEVLKLQRDRRPEYYSNAPAIGEHTPGWLQASVTTGGRAFGLIPEEKGWEDDLINWSAREFRNPADAVRIQKCWNAFVGMDSDHIDEGGGLGDDWSGFLKEDETPFERLMREINDSNELANLLAEARTIVQQSIEREAVLMASIREKLTRAHDALEGMSDSDLDHFETDEEEIEGAPAQYAARTIFSAVQEIDAALAAYPAPSSDAALIVAVAVNELGATVVVSRHSQDVQTVIYSETHQPGDESLTVIPAHPANGAQAGLSDAARDVLAERRRQIEQEGYDIAHDDEHVNDEMAAYATFYAMPPGAREWPAEETGYGLTWGEAIIPEHWGPAKSGVRRSDLIKAGALIVAEIERLDRAAARKNGAAQ